MVYRKKTRTTKAFCTSKCDVAVCTTYIKSVISKQKVVRIICLHLIEKYSPAVTCCAFWSVLSRRFAKNIFVLQTRRTFQNITRNINLLPFVDNIGIGCAAFVGHSNKKVLSTYFKSMILSIGQTINCGNIGLHPFATGSLLSMSVIESGLLP